VSAKDAMIYSDPAELVVVMVDVEALFGSQVASQYLVLTSNWALAGRSDS